MTVEKMVDMIASDVEGAEQVALIEDFLKRRGRRGLTFFYQACREHECLRVRVYVSDSVCVCVCVCVCVWLTVCACVCV